LNTLKTGRYNHFQESSEVFCVDIWTNRNSVSVAMAIMTFHFLHFYCLILQSNGNIFFFLRSIFLNFFFKIYGWKRNDILKFEGMFKRQVLRYSWITTTKNLSDRISWNFYMFGESSCLANVQRKREKNSPKSSWSCWRDKISIRHDHYLRMRVNYNAWGTQNAYRL
jgi:hypothetical protein